jgi:hypothetical protein
MGIDLFVSLSLIFCAICSLAMNLGGGYKTRRGFGIGEEDKRAALLFWEAG